MKEKVERRPDRVPDVRHPEKVERRPNRIPDVRYPENVGGEGFRMRDVRVEWAMKNPGCEMSGWNGSGEEFRIR